MADQGSSLFLGELDSLTKDPKATDDFSSLAVEVIQKSRSLAECGKVHEGIDELLAVEKRARQASDAISVSKLTQQILRLCREHGDWRGINDYIAVLAKKRGQLKRAIVDMVQLSMTWLDEAPSKQIRLDLIETLSQVTEGKIFVEVERARLIRILSKIKEDDGDIENAASLLQEVQVETFGTMERREKTEYILEQMRIVLAKNDFVRCQIISKKINPKLLEADDFQDLKLRFYEYLIRYHLHEDEVLEVAKALFASFNTPRVQADPNEWKPALEAYILYLILAPFSNEKSDLLNKVQAMEEKKLEELSTFKRLVSALLTVELIQWPFPYEAELRQHTVFSSVVHEGGDERWNLFRTRVVQQNIKTLAVYYNKIHLSRAAELLRVSSDEAETLIAELVTSGFLAAQMDRPAGIVSFGGRKTATDRLNDWSHDISKILDILEESSHLIEKERMIHAAQTKKRQALQKSRAA